MNTILAAEWFRRSQKSHEKRIKHTRFEPRHPSTVNCRYGRATFNGMSNPTHSLRHGIKLLLSHFRRINIEAGKRHIGVWHKNGMTGFGAPTAPTQCFSPHLRYQSAVIATCGHQVVVNIICTGYLHSLYISADCLRQSLAVNRHNPYNRLRHRGGKQKTDGVHRCNLLSQTGCKLHRHEMTIAGAGKI